MKWIYDDYDFENRMTNLMWTVSGDYTQKLENNEIISSSKDLSIYYAIQAGAMRKYIDWDKVKKYMGVRIKNGADKDMLLSLIQMGSDLIVQRQVIDDRPGVEDIRNTAYQEMFKKFFSLKTSNILEKVKYALVLDQMGKHPSLDIVVLKILNDVKKLRECKDTLELLENIDNIYIKYFEDVINDENYNYEVTVKERKSREIDFDTFSDFMNDELYSDYIEEDISESVDDIAGSLLIESVGDVNNDNFLNPKGNRIIYVDEENIKKIYEKIEYHYGKSFLTFDEIREIERRCSRGVHEGCRVHFTDGVLRTECDNTFQIKYVSKHKEHNMHAYRDNLRVYKRSISKLEANIRRVLVKEKDKNLVVSSSGILCPNKLWRVNRSTNPKLFNKILENEKGGYVVDILLDASGSQRARQQKVAIQGYIISQSLTKAGIPNRVMSFCSFLDYTILRRYRDYKSPIKENENIFEYFCAGNNRDGLAIKAVCQGLISEKEENKILIVLSDGRPNDVKIGNKNERTIRGEMSYKGIIGAKDTASEVRKARNEGINVLGVFTGKEEELYIEKLIYGRDFVYTKNIERFSDIVGMYLKKIIEY